MLHPNFVIVGAIIFLIGSAGYVIDTVKGLVKPNRVTWFIWSLAPLIAFAAQVKQGIGMESLMTLVIGLVPVMVFAASFINRKSYWKIEKLDVICGLLSIVGLVLWQLTKVGNVAIFFSLLADFLAFLPTMIKSYRHPETENYLLYLANSIFALLTLLTIKDWNFANYSFPLYIFLATLLLAVSIKFKIVKLVKVFGD
ncbi:MAG: hypothetical protein ACOYUB_00770 [Patescibacteria group bacterium]